MENELIYNENVKTLNRLKLMHMPVVHLMSVGTVGGLSKVLQLKAGKLYRYSESTIFRLTQRID